MTITLMPPLISTVGEMKVIRILHSSLRFTGSRFGSHSPLRYVEKSKFIGHFQVSASKARELMTGCRSVQRDTHRMRESFELRESVADPPVQSAIHDTPIRAAIL